MNLRSIRWRLPLSYAAIALVAALALGAVLLAVLRSYYSQQELVYLRGNAKEIGAAAGKMLQNSAPSDALNAQMELYALLSQVQVRVYDAKGKVLAESRKPGAYQVVSFSKIDSGAMGVAGTGAKGAVPVQPTPAAEATPDTAKGQKQASAAGEKAVAVPEDESEQALMKLKQQLTDQPTIYINLIQAPEGLGAGGPTTATVRLPAQHTIVSGTEVLSVISAVGTSQGIGFDTQTVIDGRRSSQVVTMAILDGNTGTPIGSVELSNGPAYGQRILDAVAQGWVLAGAVAVLLAAIVGYWISRAMSRPLMALTAATTRMAGGDLAARASVTPRDEIGQLACAYNQMAEQIETTITALRRFVADAAHELHTPLTALRTNLELAGGEGQAEAQREFLRRAQEQVDRLDRLSSSLLDLSRLEAQAESPEMAPLDLAALALIVSEPYASRAEQSGLAFSLDLPQEPVTVRGNGTQLTCALANLLDNACKFAAPGGQITLRLTREDGWASLAVEDTGLGIPAEDLAQLGTRFHRGRNAAGYPGNGLGLAIVRAIAGRHGGELRAEDTGQGARFTLRVPVV